MKKRFSILGCLVLVFTLMIYSSVAKANEVIKLEDDIKGEYENIIIKNGSEKHKLIALTFDDGPDEDFTPQILDILKKHDVVATFFVVGQKVTWHPDIAKRQHEEGHELGNHTFTHINVSKRSYEEIKSEIDKTQEVIKNVTGMEPKIFRPPYRAISNNMLSIMKERNMNVILWSNLDPKDWSNPGVSFIVNTINEKKKNGNIILLHDYNNKRNSKSQTIEALDIIIPILKEQGYDFVTVSELIEKMDKQQETQN